ncbi:MAG: hypothetical protein AAB729_01370 [Patescibacteria group bacterium]
MATTNSTVKLMAGFVSGNVVFYAVLIPNRWLVRNTSIRMVLVNTVKEFGLAELFDTGFIRPALIFVCFWLTQSETMGSTWGHGVADLVFYYMGFSNTSLKIAETFGSFLARIVHSSASF